jgi:hypothetical protein
MRGAFLAFLYFHTHEQEKHHAIFIVIPNKIIKRGDYD